jgi:hypothetical protein
LNEEAVKIQQKLDDVKLEEVEDRTDGEFTDMQSMLKMSNSDIEIARRGTI